MNRNANSNENGNQQPQQKKKNWIFVGIGAIIIILVLLLLLRGCDGSPAPVVESPQPTTSGFTIGDTNKIQETDDAATRQQKLNDQVAEGMMTISMNLSPIFEDGTSKGNLLIVNDEGNRYPQVIQIYLDEEKIYESPGIEVGHEIQEDKLAVDLEKGTYDCLAYFIQFDPDTGNELGRAAANIKLTVQN